MERYDAPLDAPGAYRDRTARTAQYIDLYFFDGMKSFTKSHFFCCKSLGAIWDRMTTFRRFKRVLADYTRTFKKNRIFKTFLSKICVMKLFGW